MRRALLILPWLAVLILAVVGYRYATRTTRLAADLLALNARAGAALAARDSLKRSGDLVAKASIARQDSINALSASVLRSNAESESLRNQLATLRRPAQSDSTNPNWQRLNERNERLAASETMRADSTAKQFDLMGADRDMWKARATMAGTVADSLAAALVTSQQTVHTLQSIAAHDDCRIAWLLPCPSRKVVAVLAVAGTLVVHNNSRQISDGLKGLLP